MVTREYVSQVKIEIDINFGGRPLVFTNYYCVIGWADFGLHNPRFLSQELSQVILLFFLCINEDSTWAILLQNYRLHLQNEFKWAKKFIAFHILAKSDLWPLSQNKSASLTLIW